MCVCVLCVCACVCVCVVCVCVCVVCVCVCVVCVCVLCVCACVGGCRTADRSKDGVSYLAGVSVEDEGDVVVVKTAANGEDEGRGGRK